MCSTLIHDASSSYYHLISPERDVFLVRRVMTAIKDHHGHIYA